MGRRCQDFGFAGGFQLCMTDCTVYCTGCGNGVVEMGDHGEGEQCDDGDGAVDCEDADCWTRAVCRDLGGEAR